MGFVKIVNCAKLLNINFMGEINITSKNQSGGITAQHVVANNENSPVSPGLF